MTMATKRSGAKGAKRSGAKTGAKTAASGGGARGGRAAGTQGSKGTNDAGKARDGMAPEGAPVGRAAPEPRQPVRNVEGEGDED